MRFFDWLFGHQKEQKISRVLPIPVVGSIYSLKPDEENPFPQRGTFVQVTEVKSGWVRYDFLPVGGSFQNQAREIDNFLSIYSLHKRHDEAQYHADFLSGVKQP